MIGEDEAVLFDTGMPVNWPAIDQQLDLALAGRSITWLVPSHPEIPHAGNLGRLLRKYPEATVIGDTRDYHLYFPEIVGRSQMCGGGTELDLGGGYKFIILDAPLKDARNTVWAYEVSQQVLFTSDGFQFSHNAPSGADELDDLPIHRPGDCALFTSELRRPPGTTQVFFATRGGLSWTRDIGASAFIADARELLQKYPTRILASSHGNMVDDLEPFVAVVEEAYDLLFQEAVQPKNKA